ncbi:hypothetical protein [Morganella morganii]|nr:hypothetical protein [Morganella morganii]MQC16399.1 hypothetical protein [Morganella morganii]
MKDFTKVLKQHCKIIGEDLMVTFISNTKNDWSFCFGVS